MSDRKLVLQQKKAAEARWNKERTVEHAMTVEALASLEASANRTPGSEGADIWPIRERKNAWEDQL